MAPTMYRPTSTKTETVTFIGTGKNGATLKGGPIVVPESAKGELPDKLPAATNGHGNGKVHLQGDVIQSVIVADHVNNTESLTFKGKIASSEKKPKSADESIALGGGAAVANITVVHDLKKSLVCNSMTTNGICFGSDE